MTDRFDWRNADLAVRPQAAIAIYVNAGGDCVIRQMSGPLESRDECVVVTRANVLPLIAALENWLNSEFCGGFSEEISGENQ